MDHHHKNNSSDNDENRKKTTADDVNNNAHQIQSDLLQKSPESPSKVENLTQFCNNTNSTSHQKARSPRSENAMRSVLADLTKNFDEFKAKRSRKSSREQDSDEIHVAPSVMRKNSPIPIVNPAPSSSRGGLSSPDLRESMLFSAYPPRPTGFASCSTTSTATVVIPRRLGSFKREQSTPNRYSHPNEMQTPTTTATSAMTYSSQRNQQHPPNNHEQQQHPPNNKQQQQHFLQQRQQFYQCNTTHPVPSNRDQSSLRFPATIPVPYHNPNMFVSDNLATFDMTDCIDMCDVMSIDRNQDDAYFFSSTPPHFHIAGDIIGYAKVVRSQRDEAIGQLNNALSGFDEALAYMRKELSLLNDKAATVTMAAGVIVANMAAVNENKMTETSNSNNQPPTATASVR